MFTPGDHPKATRDSFIRNIPPPVPPKDTRKIRVLHSSCILKSVKRSPWRIAAKCINGLNETAFSQGVAA